VELKFEKPALKALRKMQRQTAEVIIEDLEKIARAPFANHPQASRLQGTSSSYRLRHGDWRVLYRLDRASDTMIVEDVRRRGQAYR
jgi:mRNA interferase RelE/StbE